MLLLAPSGRELSPKVTEGAYAGTMLLCFYNGGSKPPPYTAALPPTPHPPQTQRLRSPCLAAARSRSGSNVPPARHSTPSRRFATRWGRQDDVARLFRRAGVCSEPPKLIVFASGNPTCSRRTKIILIFLKPAVYTEKSPKRFLCSRGE